MNRMERYLCETRSYKSQLTECKTFNIRNKKFQTEEWALILSVGDSLVHLDIGIWLGMEP